VRKAPRGEEKSSRVTAVLSAGARGYAPDPVFEIAGKALDRANDSEKAVDSFCAASNGRGQIEIGRAAAQSQNRKRQFRP